MIQAHISKGRQAGMIVFITLQQSAPSQMILQDSNASMKHSDIRQTSIQNSHAQA
jgi:hypothetical protein